MRRPSDHPARGWRWTVLAGAAVALALALGIGSDSRPVAAQPEPAADSPQLGLELYQRDCVYCHGVEGEGTFQGTPLVDVGAASASFWLTTGRMPIRDADDEITRSDPPYDAAEIDALVDYVAGFGDGPPVPEVDVAGADLALGGDRYRLHCAPCHSVTGIGGGLAYGEIAPPVFSSTPTQVVESMIVGPGTMPSFFPDALTAGEMDAVAAYVEELKSPQHRGGLPLGRAGRVDEGLVAWVLGLLPIVLLLVWIGRRVTGD